MTRASAVSARVSEWVSHQKSSTRSVLSFPYFLFIFHTIIIFFLCYVDRLVQQSCCTYITALLAGHLDWPWFQSVRHKRHSVRHWQQVTIPSHVEWGGNRRLWFRPNGSTRWQDRHFVWYFVCPGSRCRWKACPRERRLHRRSHQKDDLQPSHWPWNGR